MNRAGAVTDAEGGCAVDDADRVGAADHARAALRDSAAMWAYSVLLDHVPFLHEEECDSRWNEPPHGKQHKGSRQTWSFTNTRNDVGEGAGTQSALLTNCMTRGGAMIKSNTAAVLRLHYYAPRHRLLRRGPPRWRRPAPTRRSSHRFITGRISPRWCGRSSRWTRQDSQARTGHASTSSACAGRFILWIVGWSGMSRVTLPDPPWPGPARRAGPGAAPGFRCRRLQSGAW